MAGTRGLIMFKMCYIVKQNVVLGSILTGWIYHEREQQGRCGVNSGAYGPGATMEVPCKYNAPMNAETFGRTEG